IALPVPTPHREPSRHTHLSPLPDVPQPALASSRPPPPGPHPAPKRAPPDTPPTPDTPTTDTQPPDPPTPDTPPPPPTPSREWRCRIQRRLGGGSHAPNRSPMPRAPDHYRCAGMTSPRTRPTAPSLGPSARPASSGSRT